MHTWLAALEILGAIIGAGFASGREIAAFFARFGWWGLPGIVLACVCAGAILYGAMRPGRVGGMPEGWRRTPMERVWKGLFALLMIFTGGAMLAASGEAAALALPFHGAKWLGMAAAFGMAWRMSRQESKGLPAVSQGLVVCLVCMMLAGFVLPKMQSISVGVHAGGLPALAYGAAYGGFNAALAAPGASRTAKRMDSPARKRCVLLASFVLGVLLLCADAVLMRHTALQAESLPFAVMLSAFGKPGYYLCLCVLYLAVLTTLCACLRGLTLCLPGSLGAAAVALAALWGFEGVVGVAYPVLGGMCTLLLLGAEMTVKKT